MATALLTGLGVASLASCIDGETEPGPKEADITSALTGTTFKWVDTMLNLIALPTNPPNPGAPPEQVLVLQGYVTPHDGGGGVFVWDPTSTAADNAGTIIRPNDRAAGVAGRWRRQFSGALNVRWFGAQGNNINTDHININLAIAATAATGGGEVHIPPGIYKTTGPIVINLPSVRLTGAGASTRIRPVGGLNTIELNSNTTNCRFVEISNLQLEDSQKTSGKGIYAIGVSDLLITDVFVVSPWEGIHLHNFNHVGIERVNVVGPRSCDGYGFWLSGGGTPGTGRSDVISFRDVTVFGPGPLICRDPNTEAQLFKRHGLLIDGAVSTVSVSKLYILGMQGAGVWFRNAVGAPANPEFASFYGLEVDFPHLEGIRIEVGQRLNFTDTMIHQSADRTNIAIGTSLNTTVNTVTFKGGFSSAAEFSGLDIWASDVSVQGMNILRNSRRIPSSSNGAPGIEIRSSAQRIAITGNTIGDPELLQAYGIRVAATSYAVVGNIASDNFAGGIRAIAGSSPGIREIVGNVGTVV